MIDRIYYRLRTLRELLPYYRGVKKFMLVNLIITIVITTLTYINPVVYKIFIDDVILGGQFYKIKIVMLGYALIFIINIALGYLKLYLKNIIINRSTFLVKMKIWSNIFHKQFIDYDKINIGDYQMKIGSDVDEIEQFADTQTISYFVNCISLIVLMGILFAIDWRLAIISIIIIPITFYLDYLVGKGEKKVLEIDRINREEQAKWMHVSIQGWKEIKALNLKTSEINKLLYYIKVFENFFGRWNLYATTRKLVIPKIKDEFVMQFIMYFVGGIFIMQGKFTIGLLLVFMQYYNYFSDIIKTVSQTDTDLLTGRVKSERILNEMEVRYPRVKQRNKINQIGKISYEHVHFQYPMASVAVIKDLSFSINQGERVAIVGESGAGKTTIMKLLLGLLEKDDGLISIGEHQIEDIDISSLHNRIGVIMQDNFLFNSTILENLLLGKPNATLAECVEACKKANIYEFIESLPQKFNTIIGERGIKLSGGQKQRIVLARAFLKNVEAYIFDEATSALDQYSESLIHDVIDRISSDKTIIVIAHRQSSIDLCNRVIRVG